MIERYKLEKVWTCFLETTAAAELHLPDGEISDKALTLYRDKMKSAREAWRTAVEANVNLIEWQDWWRLVLKSDTLNASRYALLGQRTSPQQMKKPAQYLCIRESRLRKATRVGLRSEFGRLKLRHSSLDGHALSVSSKSQLHHQCSCAGLACTGCCRAKVHTMWDDKVHTITVSAQRQSM